MSDDTYLVRCFCYADDNLHHGEVVKAGLTLAEAQAHCNDPATAGDDAEHGGPWFHGYDREGK